MDFTQYKNTLPYPARADFTATYWYRAGKTVAQRNGDGEIEILDPRVGTEIELGACTKETLLSKEDFNANRTAYHAETARLEALFKADLLEELDITGHPKANALFEIAWEQSHGNGLSDVVETAWELLPLIVD